MELVFQFSNFIPQPIVSTSLFARRSALIHAPSPHEGACFQWVIFKWSVFTNSYLEAFSIDEDLCISFTDGDQVTILLRNEGFTGPEAAMYTPDDGPVAVFN
ncbi:MAG: hypothetical protein ACI9DC_005247 [Gammaproteobacteria bacterium]|jgi:hypothetical protein